jgi:hypothetical protein
MRSQLKVSKSSKIKQHVTPPPPLKTTRTTTKTAGLRRHSGEKSWSIAVES